MADVENHFCKFNNTYSGNIKSIKIGRRNYTAKIRIFKYKLYYYSKKTTVKTTV